MENISMLVEEFAPRGTRERDLFVGRFNPFHSGHAAIVKMMKNNPLIVIVKGKKTSEDKKKNPFSEDYQSEMVKSVFSDVEVTISPNAFLAGICGFYRKKGDEITRIFAGADRIESYRKSINDANLKMDPEYQYKIEFIETPRVTSATKVRQTFVDDDFEEFKKNMPRQLWSEFEKMRDIYLRVNESFISFSDWLIENDTVTTSAGSMDSFDKPFSSKKRNRGIHRMLGMPELPDYEDDGDD